MLAFHEPEDYLPRPAWLRGFTGLPAEETWLRRGLAGVAGATLSSEAIARAVRRVLALHGEIHAPPGDAP